MQFTHEHEELRRTVARFVASEIDPHVDEWEAEETFPAHALFKKLGNLGLLGLTKPEAYGGMGLDYSFAIVMAESLGKAVCGAITMAIGIQTDMATPALARFGSDALCREFLAPAIRGDVVTCVGVSEPGASSDVAAIKTKARKSGGDYVINGAKLWITNSLQADWMCLLANTSDAPVESGRAHKNKSLIIVPMNAKGVRRAKKINKIGMTASDIGLIHFDDVRVPQHHCIGEEGLGLTYQLMQFQEERLWTAANAIETLLGCIDITADYTRERCAFGKPTLDNRLVNHTLAELKTEVEALRGLTYLATEHYLAGRDVTEWASMAKLKAGRLLRNVPDACLQFWGGTGFTFDNRVSRLYRDGRLDATDAATDEVMLGIISNAMHALPGRR